MKFYPNVINNAKNILAKKKMKHRHTIVIGENASGKSEVFKQYIGQILLEEKNIYYIDSVNRYFDVSKVSTPYSKLETSSIISVVKTRMENEYFNLKDTFSLFRSLNDQVELIYLVYKEKLQRIFKEFLGFSFELVQIKEKKVWFDREAEGVLSSGLQALVRIFLELLYLDDMVDNEIIVVIDEIDEFLSPVNSGKILNFITDQFPKMSFVVSTHSIDLVRNAKKCNIMILYSRDIEVVDADDFCDEIDVTYLFEKVFSINPENENTVESKLRILLNNRVSNVWTDENEAELLKMEKADLTNSQKLLLQQIKEW